MFGKDWEIYAKFVPYSALDSSDTDKSAAYLFICNLFIYVTTFFQ
jgi:hypothetical protein